MQGSRERSWLQGRWPKHLLVRGEDGRGGGDLGAGGGGGSGRGVFGLFVLPLVVSYPRGGWCPCFCCLIGRGGCDDNAAVLVVAGTYKSFLPSGVSYLLFG